VLTTILTSTLDHLNLKGAAAGNAEDRHLHSVAGNAEDRHLHSVAGSGEDRHLHSVGAVVCLADLIKADHHLEIQVGLGIKITEIRTENSSNADEEPKSWKPLSRLDR
jgi:hypothetical protein